ncbi:MAG: hypothetical protein O9322_09525 [Beijerinckiaceae bacterium]|nr:hypothetical protein [Beijerinckiaceae bacterium]MCZ8299572.1 hypothetical protein [Beijerinckiaceae bacterium]
MEQTEKSRLDRRGALKALFGFAVVAAGATALMAPTAAEAAPALKPEGALPEAEPAGLQDMAPDSELPESEQTQYYYYRRPVRRRVVYYRPVRRRVVYVRPRRRVYYVRRRRYW